MQCCESLDETRSWAHGLSPASNPTEEGFVTWMLRQARAGALRIPLDWAPRRLEHWGEKLNLYSYRTMKYPEDGIRAFAGVLQRLETVYPEGYFQGLPVEDFDWALLWRSQLPPVRREGFPTWSWAGWQGPLFFGQPIDVKKTRRFPTFLEIEAVSSGRLKQIFATSGDSSISGDQMSIVIRNDPIDKASHAETPASELDLERIPPFTPNFDAPGKYQRGEYETFEFEIRNVRCLLSIMNTDRYIPGQWISNRWVLDRQEQEEWTCMLVARDHLEGFVLHHLMLVKMQTADGIAERATVFELLVPLDNLDVLDAFRPQKRRIILR